MKKGRFVCVVVCFLLLSVANVLAAPGPSTRPVANSPLSQPASQPVVKGLLSSQVQGLFGGLTSSSKALRERSFATLQRHQALLLPRLWSMARKQNPVWTRRFALRWLLQLDTKVHRQLLRRWHSGKLLGSDLHQALTREPEGARRLVMSVLPLLGRRLELVRVVPLLPPEARVLALPVLLKWLTLRHNPQEELLLWRALVSIKSARQTLLPQLLARLQRKPALPLLAFCSFLQVGAYPEAFYPHLLQAWKRLPYAWQKERCLPLFRHAGPKGLAFLEGELGAYHWGAVAAETLALHSPKGAGILSTRFSKEIDATTHTPRLGAALCQGLALTKTLPTVTRGALEKLYHKKFLASGASTGLALVQLQEACMPLLGRLGRQRLVKWLGHRESTLRIAAALALLEHDSTYHPRVLKALQKALPSTVRQPAVFSRACRALGRMKGLDRGAAKEIEALVYTNDLDIPQTKGICVTLLGRIPGSLGILKKIAAAGYWRREATRALAAKGKAGARVLLGLFHQSLPTTNDPERPLDATKRAIAGALHGANSWGRSAYHRLVLAQLALLQKGTPDAKRAGLTALGWLRPHPWRLTQGLLSGLRAKEPLVQRQTLQLMQYYTYVSPALLVALERLFRSSVGPEKALARALLGRMPEAIGRVFARLEQELGGSQPLLQQRAAHALLSLPLPDALRETVTTRLLPFLKHENTHVRDQVLRFFQAHQLYPLRALGVLQPMVHRVLLYEPLSRPLATYLLKLLARHTAAAQGWRTSLQALFGGVSSATNRVFLVEAIDLLAPEDEANLAFLVQALQDRAGEVRYTAFQALGSFKELPKQRLAAYTSLLQARSLALNLLGLRLLRVFGVEATKALVVGVRHRDALVRYRALMQLRLRPRWPSVLYLPVKRLIQDPRPWLRRLAREVLPKIQRPGPDPSALMRFFPAHSGVAIILSQLPDLARRAQSLSRWMGHKRLAPAGMRRRFQQLKQRRRRSSLSHSLLTMLRAHQLQPSSHLGISLQYQPGLHAMTALFVARYKDAKRIHSLMRKVWAPTGISLVQAECSTRAFAWLKRQTADSELAQAAARRMAQGSFYPGCPPLKGCSVQGQTIICQQQASLLYQSPAAHLALWRKRPWRQQGLRGGLVFGSLERGFAYAMMPGKYVVWSDDPQTLFQTLQAKPPVFVIKGLHALSTSPTLRSYVYLFQPALQGAIAQRLKAPFQYVDIPMADTIDEAKALGRLFGRFQEATVQLHVKQRGWELQAEITQRPKEPKKPKEQKEQKRAQGAPYLKHLGMLPQHAIIAGALPLSGPLVEVLFQYLKRPVPNLGQLRFEHALAKLSQVSTMAAVDGPPGSTRWVLLIDKKRLWKQALFVKLLGQLLKREGVRNKRRRGRKQKAADRPTLRRRRVLGTEVLSLQLRSNLNGEIAMFHHGGQIVLCYESVGQPSLGLVRQVLQVSQKRAPSLLQKLKQRALRRRLHKGTKGVGFVTLSAMAMRRWLLDSLSVYQGASPNLGFWSGVASALRWVGPSWLKATQKGQTTTLKLRLSIRKQPSR